MAHALSHANEMPLSASQLDAYLARVGIDRPVSLDIAGLSKLHRAHLMAFTWEALDAFMGWPSTITPASAFAKMVEGRRGGWCYEMNGLFGAALSAHGFRVSRLCGGVDREKIGDIAIGTVRKIPVQMRLLPKAVQNTPSLKIAVKLSSPMNCGAEIPSQLKNASAMVSSAGTRMMAKLIARVGTR